ncbi:amidohydrolase family protein [candidate division KSB1 bacterium]|nr:amidohydrolase family protein [candidate division KSB1 bacterium]
MLKLSEVTKFFVVFLFIIFLASFLHAQEKTAYPDIPRIDVHTHIGSDLQTVSNFLDLREQLKEKYNIDVAMWINLGSSGSPIIDLDSFMKAGQDRILCSISDYSPHDGFDLPPLELPKKLEEGYIGFKIWAGPPARRLKPGQIGFPYIDNPAHEPTFAKMEEIGMLATSIHIADPNGPFDRRTRWLPDPVEYWRQIMAFRHVLESHPNLKVVTAHAMWAICQDAQIDYLRNALATFPNLNVDLAATFQYFNLVTYDNLRSFLIDYADRIVYGTDIGQIRDADGISSRMEAYNRSFQILETDKMVDGGFFGSTKTKGLALPKEVLEKIYYKNAMRLYPKVREHLEKLGYTVD